MVRMHCEAALSYSEGLDPLKVACHPHRLRGKRGRRPHTVRPVGHWLGNRPMRFMQLPPHSSRNLASAESLKMTSSTAVARSMPGSVIVVVFELSSKLAQRGCSGAAKLAGPWRL